MLQEVPIMIGCCNWLYNRFRVTQKCRFELCGSAVGRRYELGFAMLMPPGRPLLFLTMRYTWHGLSALFIKNNYSSRLFIYDFIRTP